MNFHYTAAGATNWCRSGHLLGWDQTALPTKPQPPAKTAKRRTRAALELRQVGESFLIGGRDWEGTASAKSGHLEFFRWRGQDLYIAEPVLQVWRGPTDNDGIKGQPPAKRALDRWCQLGLDRFTVRCVRAKAHHQPDGSIRFACEHVGSVPGHAATFRHPQVYTVRKDGSIRAENVFSIPKALADLPRLGATCLLPMDLERLRWFGRGPFENYSDRNRAAMMDVHESSVAEQDVPHVMPQEHGNRTDVRWLTLQGTGGWGLRVEAEDPLEFSASRFSAQDLDAARHTYDLKLRPEVILNLAYRQRGLGTGSCGPDTLERYTVPAGSHLWNYPLRPLP